MGDKRAYEYAWEFSTEHRRISTALTVSFARRLGWSDARRLGWASGDMAVTVAALRGAGHGRYVPSSGMNNVGFEPVEKTMRGQEKHGG